METCVINVSLTLATHLINNMHKCMNIEGTTSVYEDAFRMVLSQILLDKYSKQFFLKHSIINS